ncbi:MAG: hypothetical protein ABWZ98_14950 [Nakamurella sp.]
MPAHRSDDGRRTGSTPNIKRASHSGIPAQRRRAIPAPDGVLRVRGSGSRRDLYHADPAGRTEWVSVPRGFPIGDPGYQPMPGRPDAADPAGYLDDDPAGDPDAADPADNRSRRGWGARVGWTRIDPAERARLAFVAATPPAPSPARAARTAREPEGRVLRRVGTGRAPFRSAAIGGALLAAVLGAGVAAWAMAPTDQDNEETVVTQVDQSGRIDAIPSGGAATGSVAVTDAPGTAEQPAPTIPTDPEPAASAPAPGSAELTTSQTGSPPADLGPATVSALQSGDPGFGWPATAFGLPPEPAADQPLN